MSTWVKIGNLKGPKGDAGDTDAMNRFDAIEAKNTAQDTRLTNVEAKNTAQDTAITDARTYTDSKDTSNRAAWASADASNLTAAKSYTDAEAAKDRVRLAEHDTRSNGLALLLGMIPLVYGRELIPLTELSPDGSTLGLWHFDGSLADSSGNGHTLTQLAGTPQGSYTTARFGGGRALGSGIYEDADADAGISVTGANGGAYKPFTVECWVRTARHTGIKVAVGHNRWFWLGITAAGQATADIGDQAAAVRLTGTTAIAPVDIADATWHHLALVLDTSGANTYVRLFVDGKAEHTLPFDGKVTGSTAGGATFAVGGLSTTRAFDFSLTPGSIDEVRVSNVARYKDRAGTYPPRPNGLPGGYAKYIGTATPTDKLPFDEWIKVATA